MMHKLFADFPGIETDRLIIRKLIPEDAKDIYEFTSRDEVTSFLTWDAHKNIERTRSFLGSIIDKYEKNKVSQWGIELKEKGTIIGIAGFINYWEDHAKAEVAFVLSPDYWGKGYMPEALNSIMDHGFQEMALHRIEAKCEIDNFASEKAMQKIGMKLEGCKYDFLIRKGQFRSFKFYAKLFINKD